MLPQEIKHYKPWLIPHYIASKHWEINKIIKSSFYLLLWYYYICYCSGCCSCWPPCTDGTTSRKRILSTMKMCFCDCCATSQGNTEKLKVPWRWKHLFLWPKEMYNHSNCFCTFGEGRGQYNKWNLLSLGASEWSLSHLINTWTVVIWYDKNGLHKSHIQYLFIKPMH